MNEPVPSIISLETLRHEIIGLSDGWGGFLCEASTMSLHYNEKHPGVIMSVKGHIHGNTEVTWNTPATSSLEGSWADTQEMTEYGACGIAILLVSCSTDYKHVVRSKKGTGFDYYLKLQEDGLLFQGATRLEVSGIIKGNSLDIKNRCREKVKQVNSHPDDSSAYIVVVEFGAPQGQVEYIDGSDKSTP
jgi:hypothetical protein